MTPRRGDSQKNGRRSTAPPGSRVSDPTQALPASGLRATGLQPVQLPLSSTSPDGRSGGAAPEVMGASLSPLWLPSFDRLAATTGPHDQSQAGPPTVEAVGVVAGPTT